MINVRHLTSEPLPRPPQPKGDCLSSYLKPYKAGSRNPLYRRSGHKSFIPVCALRFFVTVSRRRSFSAACGKPSSRSVRDRGHLLHLHVAMVPSVLGYACDQKPSAQLALRFLSVEIQNPTHFAVPPRSAKSLRHSYSCLRHYLRSTYVAR